MTAHILDHDSQRQRLTIIGLGNEFLSDDGVGIKVVRELKKSLNDDSVAFKELSVGGLELFDSLVGTEECIIVDALMTGKHTPGSLLRFVQTADDEPVTLTSSHQIDLGQILGLAQFLGASLPRTVTVYGIEADDITTFRETCTADVSRAIPKLVDAISKDVQSHSLQNGNPTHQWQLISDLITD
jgi:hydrogenase maturation protease